MGLALLFPGQGSQSVGMGKDLAEAFPEVRRLFEEADDLLGMALSRIAFEGPTEELTATRNAQPALLVHSVAVYRLVQERLGAVAFTAGHSLGEYSAHVVAGTLSFADALRAVRHRGNAMYESGLHRSGGMAAVLGLDDDAVIEACAAVESGVCVPANFNSPGQVVISGDQAAMDEAGVLFRERGAKKVIPLTVSGAFHSPLMADARQAVEEFLGGVSFSDPSVPVVSNVTAEAITEAGDAQSRLVEQVTEAVRWAESIQTMVDGGVERFVELGPGSVLRGLNRRNARECTTTSIGTVDDIRALESEA